MVTQKLDSYRLWRELQIRVFLHFLQRITDELIVLPYKCYYYCYFRFCSYSYNVTLSFYALIELLTITYDNPNQNLLSCRKQNLQIGCDWLILYILSLRSKYRMIRSTLFLILLLFSSLLYSSIR